MPVKAKEKIGAGVPKGQKVLVSTLTLYLEAGKATPAPPVGPALGQYGLNIAEFCKNYNAQTSKMQGYIVPAIVYVYSDRTYKFTLKTPPTSTLLLKALGIESGSPQPNRTKVGKITREKLVEIAKMKLPDLNTKNIDSAVKIVAAQAKNMGIEVVE
ncbi:MAG: 50S ribosomal protein L11 [Candidatus Calescibacterium sp.]|nr:50S ribosomal protein L11 [Candidatus Calescibacterium sp.]MDW8132620.1 50S ribosomal protein L11 [Candidatus Calescibacterium sp.]